MRRLEDMTRGNAARFIGLVVAATLITGCARSAPNPDGWWDPGVHEVDGYWVTEEQRCEADVSRCGDGVQEAIAALRTSEPDAVVTGAASAGYPRMRGEGPDDASLVIAGLQQPSLVILDLADGSRRTIGLNCGPETVDGAYPVNVCRATEFDLWRVSGS